MGNLAHESRLRATPAQLLAHWRHVASGNCAHAVLWRERDADADVLGNADLACFFNADIEKATLARHRLERELPVAQWQMIGSEEYLGVLVQLLIWDRRRPNALRASARQPTA
jgi:hypothetical protein